MSKSASARSQSLVERPLFTARDARVAGTHPSLLRYYLKRGQVEELARGVYRYKDAPPISDFRYEDLAIAVALHPRSVVCLVSALAIYGLTEEIPRQHWLAIPNSTSAKPRRNVKIIRIRDMETGRADMRLGNMSLPIFDVERTIVDAFKYLSTESAIKALRFALQSTGKKRIDLPKLHAYARKRRVEIEPFVLALTVR